jgi:hypothetical protein
MGFGWLAGGSQILKFCYPLLFTPTPALFPHSLAFKSREYKVLPPYVFLKWFDDSYVYKAWVILILIDKSTLLSKYIIIKKICTWVSLVIYWNELI